MCPWHSEEFKNSLHNEKKRLQNQNIFWGCLSVIIGVLSICGALNFCDEYTVYMGIITILASVILILSAALDKSWLILLWLLSLLTIIVAVILNISIKFNDEILWKLILLIVLWLNVIINYIKLLAINRKIKNMQ